MDSIEKSFFPLVEQGLGWNTINDVLFHHFQVKRQHSAETNSSKSSGREKEN